MYLGPTVFTFEGHPFGLRWAVDVSFSKGVLNRLDLSLRWIILFQPSPTKYISYGWYPSVTLGRFLVDRFSGAGIIVFEDTCGWQCSSSRHGG